MIKISLETNRIEFVENYPKVFPVVAIQSGQVFTILDFQHFQNRHMLWHKKYRQTNKPHDMTWFEIEEKHMMEAYIQRHKDEQVIDTLEDLKKDSEYSCSDHRLHLRVREDVNRVTKIATERHQGDFESFAWTRWRLHQRPQVHSLCCSDIFNC